MNKSTMRRFGPIEAEIIARLSYEKKTIVTTKELDDFFNFSSIERAKIVVRLKKKNILIPVKRGVYIFSPLEAGPEGIGIDEMLIPPLYCSKNSYYVGYSTMFNYYGFTEQLFQTVYVLNASFTRKKVICGITFKFLKIPRKRMYGLKKIQVKDTEVIISNKERTLIDLLYFYKPVGGIEAASKVFKKNIEEKQCNIKKLISYACKFPNITLRKRVGIIFEGLGIDDFLLRPLAKTVKKTAISSLNRSRKGIINKKWRVIVNAS